jgi:hypothetical protein
MTYGALVMLSIPPATMMSALPAASASWAMIAACMAEPHILLTVVASTLSGSPAPTPAWRAGAWPSPAGSTLPMKIICTWSGLTPARSSAAFTAAAPSSVACAPDSEPWKPPMGVRAKEAMTTGSEPLVGMGRSCFRGSGEGLRPPRLEVKV